MPVCKKKKTKKIEQNRTAKVRANRVVGTYLFSINHSDPSSRVAGWAYIMKAHGPRIPLIDSRFRPICSSESSSERNGAGQSGIYRVIRYRILFTTAAAGRMFGFLSLLRIITRVRVFFFPRRNWNIVPSAHLPTCITVGVYATTYSPPHPADARICFSKPQTRFRPRNRLEFCRSHS